MTQCSDILRRRVAEAGVLPFSQFMELALYHLEFGYYERGADQIGRHGDYYSSVSVGSLFGELLAVQFARWRPSQPGEPWQVLEAGAHDGRLAADILTAWLAWPEQLGPRPAYWILEPSPRRQAWQRARLQPFGDAVRWFAHWEELPASGVRGVIFANELLDAFPVHRVGWDASARAWFEWGVRIERDQFVWAKVPAGDETSNFKLQTSMGNAQHSTLNAQRSTFNVQRSTLNIGSSGSDTQRWDAALRMLHSALPDGFTTEICPAAAQWWRRAAQALRCGKLLTLDYGLEAEEFFLPQRAGGTLRGYYRHHPSSDLLAHPGEQDLTAPVHFAELRNIGEEAGLQTESCGYQAEFLTRIAQVMWAGSGHFGSWSSARVRQFQTLTHPEHLGRAFRVLVQGRP